MLVRKAGTCQPTLQFEGLTYLPLAAVLPDHLLFSINGLLPPALPPPLRALSRGHGHHVLMSVGEFGTGEHGRLTLTTLVLKGEGGTS